MDVSRINFNIGPYAQDAQDEEGEGLEQEYQSGYSQISQCRFWEWRRVLRSDDRVEGFRGVYFCVIPPLLKLDAVDFSSFGEGGFVIFADLENQVFAAYRERSAHISEYKSTDSLRGCNLSSLIRPRKLRMSTQELSLHLILLSRLFSRLGDRRALTVR